MASLPDLQLATAFLKQGELDLAAQEALRILKSFPRNTDALQVVGLVHTSRGNVQEAIRYLKQATAISPRIAAYRNNLGNAYLAARDFAEAIREFKYALQVDSRYFKAYLGLSIAQLKQQQGEDALKTALKGLTVQPGWTELEAQLAEVHLHTLQTEKAIETYQQLLKRQELKPAQYSNYLLALQYTSLPASAIMQEHQKFGEYIVSRPASQSLREDKLCNTSAYARIGILSNDLRTHSVAYFVQSIFLFKPEHVKLIVFYGGKDDGKDALTQFFQSKADEWITLQEVSSEKVNRIIAEGNIDILVDLGGHTSGNHLAALYPPPAPVIVHGIGYPHSTGHPSIGYRLSDATVEPEADAFSSEEKLYLDGCFLHYTPPADSPLPSFPEAEDHLYLGSFNLGNKISEACISAWATIMRQLPHARLVLKSVNSNEPLFRKNLFASFEKHGISAKNLKFLPYSKTTREHLELYSKIHFALDTFPYNGTTTTCEALWMGVPVLTLRGDRHAARVGESLLKAAGLSAFVADDTAQYVEKAIGLAGDMDSLMRWRNELRPILEASNLFDGEAYARKFYAALLQKTKPVH